MVALIGLAAALVAALVGWTWPAVALLGVTLLMPPPERWRRYLAGRRSGRRRR